MFISKMRLVPKLRFTGLLSPLCSPACRHRTLGHSEDVLSVSKQISMPVTFPRCCFRPSCLPDVRAWPPAAAGAPRKTNRREGGSPADAALSWRPQDAGALSVSALHYCPTVDSLACGLCARWVRASTQPLSTHKFVPGPSRPLDGGCTAVRSIWKRTPRCPRAWLSEPRTVDAQSALIPSAPLAPSPSSRTAFLGRPGCVLQRGYIVNVPHEAHALKHRYQLTCMLILAFRQSFRGFW